MSEAQQAEMNSIPNVERNSLVAQFANQTKEIDILLKLLPFFEVPMNLKQVESI